MTYKLEPWIDKINSIVTVWKNTEERNPNAIILQNKKVHNIFRENR